MGKGKALLLHFLAVVAGWGIVAGLRPVVATARENGPATVETRAPAKSSMRTGAPAEVAAGTELLQRIRAARLNPPDRADLSIEELIDKDLRPRGIDPATPAPKLADEGGSEEEAVEAGEYHQVLAHFLARYLNGEHGPDLAHGFRHGRLDALAIYESLATHLPGAAADHTLRRVLYRQLAPLDPVSADGLLESLSGDEATREKYEAIKNPSSPFTTITPDAAFELLVSIPEAEGLSRPDSGQNIWMELTYHFLEEYGSDYLPWLEQLPAVSGRDWAAIALLSYEENFDLPTYRRIRALVRDAGMLEDLPPR